MIAACKNHPAQRDKTMLLCLLDSGCRASEFVALNLEDVDLITGAVNIPHWEGNKRRVVFLGKRARKELRHYLKDRPGLTVKSPLWVTDEGDRLTRAGLRQVLRRLAETAGLPKEPGAHDFRPASTLNMPRNGCDIVTLSRLMGHSGLEILKRSLAHTDQDLRDAHQRNSPVDNIFLTAGSRRD